MLVADGGVDIPALEWCSILEAAIWIEHRQPPVDFYHAGALPNRIYPPLLGFRSTLDFCMDGWNRLFVLACAGGVPFRGCPAIGYQDVKYECGTPIILCDKFGDYELIPVDKIVQSGLFGFIHNGTILFYDINDTKWAYSFIQVDFRALVKRHPPAKGQAFRIGGDLMLVEPAIQRDVVSAQSTETGKSQRAPKKPRVKPSPPQESTPDTSRIAVDTVPTPAEQTRHKPHHNHHLRTQDAADYLGLSKSALEKSRSTGDGPQFIKMKKTVNYKKEDLDAWVDAHKRNSTSE